MMEWADVLSIVLAIVCGTIVGLEREIMSKAAGLRTNVLICLGAAVFTIISREMAVAGGNAEATTRIAAQVVSGVGFLGAGAIIRDRGQVQGLTTAATIWLVASIGVACGARDYILAIVTSTIAVAVLYCLRRFSKTLDHHRRDNHKNSSGL